MTSYITEYTPFISRSLVFTFTRISPAESEAARTLWRTERFGSSYCVISGRLSHFLQGRGKKAGGKPASGAASKRTMKMKVKPNTECAELHVRAQPVGLNVMFVYLI